MLRFWIFITLINYDENKKKSIFKLTTIICFVLLFLLVYRWNFDNFSRSLINTIFLLQCTCYKWIYYIVYCLNDHSKVWTIIIIQLLLIMLLHTPALLQCYCCAHFELHIDCSFQRFNLQIISDHSDLWMQWGSSVFIAFILSFKCSYWMCSNTFLDLSISIRGKKQLRISSEIIDCNQLPWLNKNIFHDIDQYQNAVHQNFI